MASPAPTHEYPNLALIRQGIEYKFVVKVRSLSIVMRPLSIFEEDQIAEQVMQEMNAIDEASRTSIGQTRRLSIKKLALASTSDVGAKDGKIHEVELNRMMPGEIDALFKSYVAGCDKLNPVLEQFDKAEVIQWVDRLKKSSGDMEMILIESSFLQLVALCRHLLTTGDSPEAK